MPRVRRKPLLEKAAGTQSPSSCFLVLILEGILTAGSTPALRMTHIRRAGLKLNNHPG
jgi:hypothetical protein